MQGSNSVQAGAGEGAYKKTGGWDAAPNRVAGPRGVSDELLATVMQSQPSHEELSSLSGQLGAGTQDNVHDLMCTCLLVGVHRVQRGAQLSGGTSGCPGNSQLEGNGWQPLDLGAAQSSRGGQGESPKPRV